jgi:hypothetical protein
MSPLLLPEEPVLLPLLESLPPLLPLDPLPVLDPMPLEPVPLLDEMPLLDPASPFEPAPSTCVGSKRYDLPHATTRKVSPTQ